VVANIATTAGLTCTGTTDSQVTACDDGYYLVDGAADTCPDCTVVGNIATDATLTCTGATDSQVTACDDGYYLVDGAADTCPDCTAVVNSAADAVLTCSSTTDSQTTGCETGYFLTVGVLGGAAATCTEMTCADTDSSGTDASCGTGGVCSEGGTGDGYTCTCDTGFFGATTTNSEAVCTGARPRP
jgi:RNA polymerase subunit RPABC4/transcription elongation factor Spt4